MWQLSFFKKRRKNRIQEHFELEFQQANVFLCGTLMFKVFLPCVMFNCSQHVHCRMPLYIALSMVYCFPYEYIPTIYFFFTLLYTQDVL